MNALLDKLIIATLAACVAWLLFEKYKRVIAEAPANTGGASPEFIRKIEGQTDGMKERLVEKKHQKAVTRIGR